MESSGKILVVDDESGIRYLLSEILADKGFNVSQAKDGQESLEQLKKNIFDLVITDINMPRLNGIEMLKSMKKAGRKEKIIIMTANPLDKSQLDGEMPQIITQFCKPFNLNNFLKVVIKATVKNEFIKN